MINSDWLVRWVCVASPEGCVMSLGGCIVSQKGCVYRRSLILYDS